MPDPVEMPPIDGDIGGSREHHQAGLTLSRATPDRLAILQAVHLKSDVTASRRSAA